MGITLNDIAAQRAMLERGEEKRKADWKLAERERLRDTFAAAALTGLLTKDDAAKPESMAPWWPEWVCDAAYRWADAMLRARSRTGQVAADTPPQSRAGTNHDAVPEACVQQSESVERGLPRTGDTPSEAEIDALEFVVEEGRTASVDDYGILRSWLIRLRPEWENQSYEESDEKRTNATMNRDATPAEGSVRGEGTETLGQRLVTHVSLSQSLLNDNEKLRAEIDQLREAIRRLAAQDATLSVCDGSVTVTMDATLTDNEREAIEAAIAWMAPVGNYDFRLRTTLQSLLERLK